MEDAGGRTGRLSVVLSPRYARFALTFLLTGTTNGASPRVVPHPSFLPTERLSR